MPHRRSTLMMIRFTGTDVTSEPPIDLKLPGGELW
jgi:hypothetical protein